MKAAILKSLDSDLDLWDLDCAPLDIGQVKVNIISSGLCGAQLQEISGLKGNGKFLPHLLGHEGCGIVEDIGSGVTTVSKGDKVIIHWRKGSGLESNFPSYLHKGQRISGGKATSLSEASVVSENRLTAVPSDTDEDLASLLGCGLSTGLSVANKDANIKLGERVVIAGAGGVGMSCILGASLSSAGRILVVDNKEDKRSLVSSDPFNADFFHTDQIKDLINSVNKIDCLIDTTGYLPLISELLPHLSDQGRCILVAQPKVNSALEILNPLRFFPSEGLNIKTSQAGGFDPVVDIPNYLRIFNKNEKIFKKSVDKLVTHRYNLVDINKAVTKLKSPEPVGRILIET